MAGPSNWTTAFTHPDPLDPNDAQRQRTQSRAGNYPYDEPTSYGASQSTAMDGDAYQDGSGHEPPEPRDDDAYTRPMSVWDRISDALGDDDNDLKPVEIGMQGRNARTLGYGRNGLREELECIDIEIDDLKRGFASLAEPAPDVRQRAGSLMDLLSSLGMEVDASDGSHREPSTYPEDEDEDYR